MRRANPRIETVKDEYTDAYPDEIEAVIENILIIYKIYSYVCVLESAQRGASIHRGAIFCSDSAYNYSRGVAVVAAKRAL